MNTQHPSIDTLIDYIHHELAPGDDARIHAHLDTCAECRAAYEAETRVGEMLRVYAHETERELPQGVVATIWDRVERERSAPSLGERVRALFRPALAIPVGLAAAAALVIGFSVSHQQSNAPVIDAAFYLNDHASMTNSVPFGEGNVVPAGLNAGEGQSAVAVTAATMTTADAR